MSTAICMDFGRQTREEAQNTPAQGMPYWYGMEVIGFACDETGICERLCCGKTVL